MGGSVTLTQRDQRLSDIRVQTSTQGTVLPKGWGRYRTNCNLVWYGDFKAIEHRSVNSQGGKGGGGGVTQETITYTYEAAVVIMLGHGPINGIPSAWKGKERLMGDAVTVRRKTLRHRVSVPNLVGGATHVVTVPSSATVVSDVSVLRINGRSTEGVRRMWCRLQRGTQYTRAGGVYTFTSLAPAGDYEITYQVQLTEADTSALEKLGMGLAHGTDDQAVWSWMSVAHADQALNYPGMAYLYASAYSLTNSAQIHNHNFEVSTGTELGSLPGRAEPVLDADPAVVVADVLLDESWGASWDAARVTGLDLYSDYCVANGLWLSPVLQEQSSAADQLGRLLQLTNTNVVWDGEVLEFVPLGDEAVTANGRTYTPATTPVVDLTADHFMPPKGSPPIRVLRHRGAPGSSEAVQGDDVGYNIWTLEIENRGNGYTTEPVSYEDTAHIAVHGRRQKTTIKAGSVKDPEVGARIAATLCQSELAQRNVYEFDLPWTMGWLRPLQIVTLTDDALDLDRKPVRILTVEEDGRTFRVSAMEADIGVASAPVYGTQAGEGYALDFNASPGVVAAPVIFEPPVELAGSTGLALWVAVTGNDAMWGGAEVWASMDDGVTYKRVGNSKGGARYGQLVDELDAGGAGLLELQLAGRGGQMFSASIEDSESLASLVFVRDGTGGPPEYLAYGSAALTSPNRYILGDLNRGAYGTSTAAKPIGSQVVRVDDLVLRSEPLDLAMIGKTVRFKFLSYNVFGAALEAMEDATEYSYTITGAMVMLPPPAITSLTPTSRVFGIDLKWNVPTGASRLRGTEVWWSATNDRATATLLDEFAYPQELHQITGLGSGLSRYFWARLVDQFGNIGPWYPAGATSGVPGATSSDATAILGYLEGEITLSQLAPALQAEIDTAGGAVTAIEQITTDLAAMITLKTQLTVDGKRYLAGIGVGIENDGEVVQSQVLVLADRFAVVQPGATSAISSPFVIEGGQVYIHQAFIGDGWITNAKIGNIIESTDFDAVAKVGWQINKAGQIRAYQGSGARQFDLGATGEDPVLKIGSALELLADGTARFGGKLTADAIAAVDAINIAKDAVIVPAYASLASDLFLTGQGGGVWNEIISTVIDSKGADLYITAAVSGLFTSNVGGSGSNGSFGLFIDGVLLSQTSASSSAGTAIDRALCSVYTAGVSGVPTTVSLRMTGSSNRRAYGGRNSFIVIGVRNG